MATELGLDVSHLYLRPVPFETANQRPVFVTAALEDGSSVDRHVEPSVIADNLLICRGSKARLTYWKIINQFNFARYRFSPTHLPLSIQELDQNHIGKFSFSSREAVSQVCCSLIAAGDQNSGPEKS